ncbi:DEAD/DEAH box helicase [Actinomyces sp. oral taxon 897]|uniref:DEAD/DEAH box helicase n=1 Tax=Actinomyces sp. oral taxon 897 TaxID=2081702 RepID=UPI0020C5075B|nr:DEAD/DEAH box helicase [Actinomyces sp. oral taxon 897]
MPLNDFAPATRTWFASAFPGGPTPVQQRAWAAIRRGENALVVAPTGSGKTLAAFLAAIDRLVQDAASERDAPRDGHGPTGRPTRTASVGKARSRSARASRRGVRVLYVSPLKALGVDVERNLRRPLAGITAAAAELGSPAVPVSVGVRSGDTPAAERRRLATRPPDILITTPESLYLMLTSAVRATLRTVETVIVDEIHSFAGAKRGTHLALSLERLDNLLKRPAQRIGLSATVAPRAEIARFLGGARPVTVIADDEPATPEVSVVVPVADMTRVPATADRRSRMDRALAGPLGRGGRGGWGDRGRAGRGGWGRTGRGGWGRTGRGGWGRAGRPGRGDDAQAWRSDRALRRAMAAGAAGPIDLAGSAGPVGPVGPSGGIEPAGPGDPAKPGGTTSSSGNGGTAGQMTASIWPHIEEAILDQVLAHRTTLVFVNSRGACERLTAHLNEAWAMRVAAGEDLGRSGGAGREEPLAGPPAGGAPTPADITVEPTALTGAPSGPARAAAVDADSGRADSVEPACAPSAAPAEPARHHESWEMARASGSPASPRPVLHHESWEMGETMRSQALPEGVPVIARAHHGSVSKEQRLAVERALKAGELRCVVATASLELGIDMGSIDIVLQVAPPPSVASGLQRVGRADHRVGGRPRGTIYPIERTQLIDAVVAAEGMRASAIERTVLVTNALDVLAQQTVAAASIEDLNADAWYATVRRAAPYAELPRAAFDSVLELLSGGFASADLADLAPRLTWDRDSGTLTARPGAQRAAVTASGTIPDRGAFPVVLPEGAQDGGRRRVGELDEEMVNETAVGDIITLGTTSWRVREIGADRVVVDPAPGRSARLPFWRGEGPGRPAATGAAKGAFLREAAGLTEGVGAGTVSAVVTGPSAQPANPGAASAGPLARPDAGAGPSAAPAGPSALAGPSAQPANPGAVVTGPSAAPDLVSRLAAAGLDASARSNLIALLREQRAATGVVPSDTVLVLERCEDESGSLRLILHSPFGRRVHEPWAMGVRERVRRGLSIEPQVVVADDGIVLQLPATTAAPGAELVTFDADELTRLVRSRIEETALFAARFRECAARALLMPGAAPGHRAPLWLQRVKAGQLLEASRQFRDFPVALEAARECLQDVYDLPALASLMERIAAGTVRVVEVTTRTPSPFAHPLLFGYTAALLYQEDLPHAERRARLLSLDPDTIAALVGDAGVAELLDAGVLARVEAELQRLAPGRRARPDAEGVADLLRELGPLTAAEVARRLAWPDGGGDGPDPASAADAGTGAAGAMTVGGVAGGTGAVSKAAGPAGAADAGAGTGVGNETVAGAVGATDADVGAAEMGLGGRVNAAGVVGDEAAGLTSAADAGAGCEAAGPVGAETESVGGTAVASGAVEPGAGRAGEQAGEQAVRAAQELLDSLAAARRAVPLRIAGRELWAGAADAVCLHRVLGVEIPDWAGGGAGAGAAPGGGAGTDVASSGGVPPGAGADGSVAPDAGAAPGVRRAEGARGPLAELVLRCARSRTTFTAAGLAERFGVGAGLVEDALEELRAQDAVLRVGGVSAAPADLAGFEGQAAPAASEGQVAPADPARATWMATTVFRRVRRRSLDAARRAVRPVPGEALQRLVLERAGLAGARADRIEDRDPLDVLAETLAALEGVPLPAAAWEGHVLPARVPGYRPGMLDELLADGDVLWRIVPEEAGERAGSTDAAGAGSGAADAARAGGAAARRAPGSAPAHGAPGDIAARGAPGGAPVHRALGAGRASSPTAGSGRAGAVSIGLIAFYPSDSPLAPVIGPLLTDEDAAGASAWAAGTGGASNVSAAGGVNAGAGGASAGSGSASTSAGGAGVAGTGRGPLPEAVLRGLATAPTFAPVRAALQAGAAPARQRRVSSRRRRGRLTGLARAASSSGIAMGPWAATTPGTPVPGTPGAGAPAAGWAGALGAPRTAWFRLDMPEVGDEERALAEVDSLLDRYGVLSRDVALAAGLPGGLTPLAPVLRRMEDVGALLRGPFVEGLGPAQLAAADVVDRLRALAAPAESPDASGSTPSDEVDGDTALVRTRRAGAEAAPGSPERERAMRRAEADVVVLDARDPACLAGGLLPWPKAALPPGLADGVPGKVERPARRSGASVVLIDGRPVLYAVENWRTLTSFTADADELERAVAVLAGAERAAAARTGRMPRRVVERLNGVPALEAGVGELLGRAGLVLDPRGMRLRLNPYGQG